MGKTIHYYNCIIKHNDNYTNISIEQFLDDIYGVNPYQRFKSISGVGNICLIGSQAPNNGRIFNGQPIDHRIRKVVFAKYRENKPYLGNAGTDRLDEIQDDILETTSVVFFPRSYIAAVEYNHIGARSRAIETYLNSFLPSSNSESWSIELFPIESELGFTDVQNSTSIKEIEFKLDLTTADRTIFNNSIGYDSVVGNLLSTAVESNIDFGANTATISFGNGRLRNRVIESEPLVQLISLLNWNSEIFEAIRIRYKSPNTNRLEKIDLKDEGILKTVLDIDDNASWELISNQTIDEHFSNEQPGNDAHHRFAKDYAVLPDLTFNNDYTEDQE